MSEVRVRIAPSPTGDPHVGTAYIALFNYCFAKSQGGKFILRIEDTDQARSTKESEAAIFRALRWVGLPYDEGPDIGGPYGPYRQSERTEIYQKHAQILLDRGSAYRCFCTEARLNQARQAAEERSKKALEALKTDEAKAAIKAKDKAKLVAVTESFGVTPEESESAEAFLERFRKTISFIGYDRHCRKLSKEEAEARVKEGLSFVVRLAMPESGKTIVKDRLRGNVEFFNQQIDDQVLLKSDGFPTYHLANVVDDYLMKITHVMRAEEWISSTPKHVVLYQAFGWESPEWIHMPLLRNKDRAKISKRKNPVSLDYYRDAGILPEALRNFLGLMGWALSGDREKFTLEEMVEKFKEKGKGIDAVHLGGPVFDLEKLWALNGLYIREIGGVPPSGVEADPSGDGSPEKLLDRLLEWRLSREYLLKVIPLVRARMTTLADFIPMTDFFFSRDLDVKSIAPQVIPKGKTVAETGEIIDSYGELLDVQKSFTSALLEQISRDFCTQKNWQPKDLFMVLRVTLTGRTATPPLFETMEVLGKELTRRRLRLMAEHLGQLAIKEAPPKPKA